MTEEREELEEIQVEDSEKKHHSRKKKKKHSKHRSEKGRRDEEEEEEEDDDDDNHYEVDGFVVGDNELDEEPEEGEKNEENESEKRPKKKKRRKEHKLDEDDLTLLADVGVISSKPNRRRLRKNESDQIDTQEFQKSMQDQLFGDDEDDDLNEGESERQEQQSARENLEDDEMSEGEESDDGLDDFIVDTDENGDPVKKKKHRRRRNRIAASSSQMREAAEVFGIGYEDLMNDEEEQSKPTQKSKIEEQFEPAVLSERYITAEDDLIRSIDIPERLQARSLNREKANANELTSEATWIYQQLYNNDEGQLDRKLISRIINVLEFIRNDHYEIPYIQRYFEDYINTQNQADSSTNPSKTLETYDLWEIYDWDEKWAHFTSRKSLLKQFYERENFDSKYVELLQDTQNELELQDLFDHFQLYSKKEEERLEENERKQRRAIRKDHYRLCKRSGILKFVPNFGITAAQLGDNMENDVTKVPTDPENTPHELAEDFECNEDFFGKRKGGKADTILASARLAAAQEIAFEPQIRRSLRGVYNERAVVSTFPTEKGKTLDVFHPMRGVIRIDQKPVKAMLTTLQWLELIKAEKDGFLTIKIELPFNQEYSPETETFFSKDMERLYLSDGTSLNAQAWNEQRKLILHEAIVKFLLPSLEKELRQKLFEESSKFVMEACSSKLYKKLIASPFRPSNSESNDSEDEMKVMACCYGQGDIPSICIILDSKGQPTSFLKLKFITMKGDTRREEELIKLQDFIIDNEPHVIAVAAEVDSRRLYDELSEVAQSLYRDRKILESIHLTYVDPEVARVFQSSNRANAEFPDYPEHSRRAVSIGRTLQEPLTELCYMAGNESKEILYLKLHPLQNLIDKEKLLETLLRSFYSVVNRVGVDINRAVQYKFASYNLQFVAGLGPRKAIGLISAITRRGGKIGSREELEGLLGNCVLANCAGFIRIRDKNIENVLDDTRIHPLDYNLVRKIAKDALESDDSMENEPVEQLVEQLMKKPEILNEIDLDAFAEEIEKKFNKPKKRSTLRYIKEEIHSPFGETRGEYQELDPKELRNLLTGENESPLRIGQIVSARVVSVLDRSVRCRLENGMMGNIKEADLSDTFKSLSDINLQEGMVLNARVIGIEEAERNFLVDLCSRSSVLSDTKQEEEQFSALKKRDPYFKKEDYSNERSKSISKKKKGFTPRRIEHPLFQNIGFQESERKLAAGDIGETILRPSSKGQNYLTLSVKFFEDIFLHITVKEEQKPNATSIGKFLWIGTQKFEAIDEIISNYVEPMIDYAQELYKFRVFRGSASKEEIENQLNEEKKSKPARIPYLISASTEHRGKFVLSYLPSRSPRHEFISVNENGFKFRGNVFKTPEKMVTWFKSHCNDPIPKEKAVEHRPDPNVGHYSNVPSYPIHPHPQSYNNSMDPYPQNWYQQQNDFAQRPPISSYNNNRDYQRGRNNQNENWGQQETSWTSGDWNQSAPPQHTNNSSWGEPQQQPQSNGGWSDPQPTFHHAQQTSQSGWD
eukprot:TRINITY_DN242_c0_g1_i1.p1 TRINITY_DN242_c0_g1~~TRINITY_DN242_c0_g1_i1.p1  ORF type:complete len:1509 (+),score=429.08 TRINITY_DN242_c0_g1_i1:233-4759(+)